MIDKLTYEEFEGIIKGLEISKENISNLVAKYKENNNVIRMEKFTNDLGRYIEYLKSTLQINKDADNVLNRLREL